MNQRDFLHCTPLFLNELQYVVHCWSSSGEQNNQRKRVYIVRTRPTTKFSRLHVRPNYTKNLPGQDDR